ETSAAMEKSIRPSEASMLQCTVGKEHQRLKDGDIMQRQKLEAANHRAAELEVQLGRKEQLILDQKKLLEDSKARSRPNGGSVALPAPHKPRPFSSSGG
ncbi:hypothetical protein KUCAC02_037087, partial [Chaenocephalus aceratus]